MTLSTQVLKMTDIFTVALCAASAFAGYKVANHLHTYGHLQEYYEESRKTRTLAGMFVPPAPVNGQTSFDQDANNGFGGYA